VCTYDEKLRDKKEGKEVILANAWYKRYWSAGRPLVWPTPPYMNISVQAKIVTSKMGLICLHEYMIFIN